MSSRIFKAIFSVTGVLVFAKIVGFIKQMITASVFGATIETDLINISQVFIQNIEYILVHTITTAFVAVYIKLRAENKEKGDILLSDAIKVVALVICCIIALSEIAAPLIAKVLAPSYTIELSSALAFYIRVYSPILFFFVLTSIFNGLLNANERFVPVQISGLLLSVITICCIFLFKESLGVDSLVVGFIVYAVFNFAFIWILSKKYWHFHKGNPFTNPNLKGLFHMMGPLFLGYSMIFINQQVDKIIVSGMEAGTVTAMSYAAVLSNMITTLTGAACTVLFTHMAVQSSNGAHSEAAGIALRSSVILITVLLPISIISITDSKDIVQIAFGRGSFNTHAVNNASLALMGYSFSFIPFAIKDLFARFLYGRQDTKSPMINASIGIVFNITFSIILSRHLGVLGVTIASSISECVACTLNILSSIKQSEYLSINKVYEHIPYWIIGVLLCILAVKTGMTVLDSLNIYIRFAVIIIMGFGGYILGLMPLIVKKRLYI